MLLETLGHRVSVAPVDVDEREIAGEAPHAYLERVVRQKRIAAEAANPAFAAEGGDADEDVLLVADTIVVAYRAEREVILQKPQDEAEGRAMLTELSGRSHEVITRFAIRARGGALHEESVATRVVFRTIAQDEIDDYVAFGEGRDKAGGYAIQGRAAAFVQRIEGSFGAVVGLPSCEVELALRAMTMRG
jgi:septum formation protein